MSIEMCLGLIVIGAAIGGVSGMLGIGGGVLLIPCLTFFFGFTQRQAVGTSLGMMLPPIGVFAFLQYYRAGQTDMRAAMILAVTFAIGAAIGGRAVTSGKVPENALRIGFALFMLYVGTNLLLKNDHHVWAVICAIAVSTTGLVIHIILRLIGRQWDRAEFPTLGETFRHHIEKDSIKDYEI